MLEMDGISSSPGVIVVGATNKLDYIDPSFLRPGRFDVVIEVPLPDEAGRREILSKLISSIKASETVKSNSFVIQLAHVTKGLSGAELNNIFQQAALESLRQNPSCQVRHYIWHAIVMLMIPMLSVWKQI